MVDAIQLKALELWNRLTDAVAHLKDERGQTATEYVAITAVGVMLAIVVVWMVLGGALNSAITAIAAKLEAFVSSPPAP